jgi:starch phosphorylase
VGEENFFLFGLTAGEVQECKARGYDPRAFYEADPVLRKVINLIAGGHFSRGYRSLFQPLVDNLLGRDDYLLLADFQAYLDCQDRVSAAYLDKNKWTEMSILNVARMGKFSSDRSIRDYCRMIWQATPIPGS